MARVDLQSIEKSLKDNLFIQKVTCGPTAVQVVYNLVHTPVRPPMPVAPELRKGLPLPATYLDRDAIPSVGHAVLVVNPADLVAMEAADRMLVELSREIGGPPGGALADDKVGHFLWLQDGVATVVARVERNTQSFVIDATVGDGGLIRPRSKVCYRPTTRPRVAIVSVWVAPDRRRRLTAFRLLREVAGHYGVQAGDLAWAAPLTPAGLQLARRLAGDRILIVGDAVAMPAGFDIGEIGRLARRGA